MSQLLPNGKQQYFDDNGLPLVGGQLFTYATDTTTPLQTTADAAGLIPNANPIILDARGEAVIFWNGAYTVTLKDALGNLIWTVNDVDAVPPASSEDLTSAVATLNAAIALLASTTAANLATDVAAVDASLLLLAPLLNPVFTGNPEAPTPAETDSSTSIATTAFVQGLVNATGTSLLALNGWEVLPSGKVNMWGEYVSGGGSPQTVTFPKSGGFPTKCCAISVVPIAADENIYLTAAPSASKTSFQVNVGAAGIPFSWTAMGY